MSDLRFQVDLQFTDDTITWDVFEVTRDNYILVERGFAPVVRDALFDAGSLIERLVPEVFQ
jgi:hypothetical protein